MHVLISSARPAADFATHSGSARNGRASDTRSASPRVSTPSATSGMLIRFDATTGMPSDGRSRPVTDVNAARGTDVTIVGTRASCQPMPGADDRRARRLDRLAERHDLGPASGRPAPDP